MARKPAANMQERIEKHAERIEAARTCRDGFVSALNARQALGNYEVDLLNAGREKEYDALEARLYTAEAAFRSRCSVREPESVSQPRGFFSRIFG